MGSPIKTTTEPQRFQPLQLQANLTKAFMLWQLFNARMAQASAKTRPASSAGDMAFPNALKNWFINLAYHPARIIQHNQELLQKQFSLWQRLNMRLLGFPGISLSDDESNKDRRFKDPAWKEGPLSEAVMQTYLNFAGYWKALAELDTRLPEQESKKAQFFLNNLLDALAPNNFPHTNPQVWQAIRDTNGDNLVKGMENLLNDFQDGELRIRMTDMQAFELGRDIATTPGQVVFRNELMELIQYTPTTGTVRKTPLLIVPPWINKYYILDLREQNSFVKWAVEQGHTVFMISWINPGSEQRDLTFDEYVEKGTLTAMDMIEQATGEREVNMVGYCLGGTLSGITLAWLAAKGDGRVKSATFFTTLLDFSEPGEIGVFLDDAQVTSIEERMDKNGGYLEGKNMGAAFNMLRANDLIWSFFVNLYLLGKDPIPFDLLYWNSDSTRMPAAMHSFYLRNMYLNNRLREPGGITVNGAAIDLSKVTTPVYFVSTQDDHIAPWKTTYKGAQLFSGPVRFVLGQSGHIAGIVNPAAKDKYGHWTNGTLATDPDQWLKSATPSKQSWWHDWDKWVSAYAGEQTEAREPGAGKLPAMCPAPGTYVKVKAG
ncbi:PHA/PHB synthase family protein [Thiothrix nivea]|uniref:Poly(R)-hydroxyalkanoic acid synthase, class I n=1 Tax=Thiothrix nivea (strain ATCC 35100 / DSM 5205 / JP2) TaxID=870187 RepID=A0A656HIB0_THINJ|nr:class I poly(R)-hydroxyalkanoic acid synthase [Thiothrix nivea]EIJ36113.1 poly(R)-hydroxyalkanoic acid synthase, class I [Thiothrix nivea DSM 5205]